MIMDWSPIIAGGITGLLSGAVSGNLVQYILDKRRVRHRRRHEFIDLWRSIVCDPSVTYADITHNPLYASLEDFMSPQNRDSIRHEVEEKNQKIKQISRELEEYIEIFPNTGKYSGTATRDKAFEEGKKKYTIPLNELETGLTSQLKIIISRELQRIEKGWGLL